MSNSLKSVSNSSSDSEVINKSYEYDKTDLTELQKNTKAYIKKELNRELNDTQVKLVQQFVSKSLSGNNNNVVFTDMSNRGGSGDASAAMNVILQLSLIYPQYDNNVEAPTNLINFCSKLNTELCSKHECFIIHYNKGNSSSEFRYGCDMSVYK